MGLWRTIKRGLTYAAFSYALTYSGTAIYAGIDYKLWHQEELEENRPPPAQDIRSFHLPDGRLLTILGENHLYNRSEAERAPRIARSYHLVAHEGGGPFDRPPLIFALLDGISMPASLAYIGATDRGHRPTIIDEACWFSSSCIALETGDNAYANTMTAGQQAALTAVVLRDLLIAPMIYFEGKAEVASERSGILDNEASWLERQAVNLEERDRIIAENLAQLIDERRSRRILCVVGRWHIDGVIRNLERRMALTPVGNPEFWE